MPMGYYRCRMKAEDPRGLAGRSVYRPDISPEELERHVAEDQRRQRITEDIDQERVAPLLR